MKDDDTPSVSEQIKAQMSWLDTSKEAVDHDVEFDQNAPDDTVVSGKTETKFNPSEGNNSPHEDGVNYNQLRRLNDASLDETNGKIRRSHVKRDAETWMSQLELTQNERERVKYLFDNTNFRDIGSPSGEVAILAYIVIVVLERDRLMGGWFWDDVAEIETALRVSHNEILQLCQELIEYEDTPPIDPSFPNL